MVSVEEAKASVPKFFIGIVLILIWLPMIITSEFNNKSNRIELNNVKNELEILIKKNELKEYYLESDYNKVDRFSDNTNDDTTAIKTDNQDTSQFIFIERYNNQTKFATKDFIYVQQEEIKESLQEDTISNQDGTEKTIHRWIPVDKKVEQRGINNLKLMSPINGDFQIKNKFNNFLDDDLINSLNHISTKDEGIPRINENGRERYRYNYNTIKNNMLVTDVSSMINSRKKIYMGFEEEFKLFLLEKGNIDKAKNQIIDRRLSSNFFQKVLWRIGNFLLFFGGLMLLIEPIRVIVEGTGGILENIPILNLVAPVFNVVGAFILQLYKYLSFGAALILTGIVTLLVYFLINYPLVSSICLGLIVGLKIYLKQKQA